MGDIRNLDNRLYEGVVDALFAGSDSVWSAKLDTQCKVDVDRAVKPIAAVVRNEKTFFVVVVLRIPC